MDDDPWAEYAEHWDEDAAGYADAAFEHLMRLLAESGPSLDDAAVCDFGAGTGLLVERLLERHGQRVARVDAVDASPAMLERLRAKAASHGWSAVHVSPDLPDADDGYDLVVCSSVLSFVDDLDATVARLARRLTSGGRFVQWDWERTDDHGHGLTRDEIRAALASAGLIDVVVGSAFEIGIEGEAVAPVFGTGRRP